MPVKSLSGVPVTSLCGDGWKTNPIRECTILSAVCSFLSLVDRSPAVGALVAIIVGAISLGLGLSGVVYGEGCTLNHAARSALTTEKWQRGKRHARHPK